MVPGLVFHHDQSRLSQMTIVDGRSSVVNDLGPNGYNLAQGTALNRPAISRLKGRPALDSDLDDLMTATVALNVGLDYHHFCVRQVQTTSENFFDLTATGMRLSVVNGQAIRQSTAGLTLSSFTAIAPGLHFLHLHHDNGTPRFRVWVDGALHATVSGGASAAYPNPSTMTTYWQFDDSTGGNEVLSLDGEHFAALVPIGTDMSVVAANALAYAREKWGTP